MDEFLSKEVIGGIVVGVVVLLIIIMGYLKAPPDTAFVISGLRRRVLIGKAGFRIPFLERVDMVRLHLMAIDVQTSSSVPTSDFIDVNVNANVTVKISSDKSLIALGAENFLNRDTEYIIGVAREVLEGNIREIIGQMSLKEMVTDRKNLRIKSKKMLNPT
jgi:flotillin